MPTASASRPRAATSPPSAVSRAADAPSSSSAARPLGLVRPLGEQGEAAEIVPGGSVRRIGLDRAGEQRATFLERALRRPRRAEVGERGHPLGRDRERRPVVLDRAIELALLRQ